MTNIKLLNKISAAGTCEFDSSAYCVGEDIQAPEAIMVRSAAMHDMEFGSELQAIARAGAGVNNIPVEKCADSGIVVFNTPGANANGVKELTVAALLMASRDIVGGIAWAGSGPTANVLEDRGWRVQRRGPGRPATPRRRPRACRCGR